MSASHLPPPALPLSPRFPPDHLTRVPLLTYLYIYAAYSPKPLNPPPCILHPQPDTTERQEVEKLKLSLATREAVEEHLKQALQEARGDASRVDLDAKVCLARFPVITWHCTHMIHACDAWSRDHLFVEFAAKVCLALFGSSPGMSYAGFTFGDRSCAAASHDKISS